MKFFSEYKIRTADRLDGRRSLWKNCITATALLVLLILSAAPTHVQAALMGGYQNPHAIIIATPKDSYTTTSAKISILGACDYEYPLTMNGNRIETTEYGFFTQYVSLEIGTNQFTFQNGSNTKVFTVIRKEVSAGGAIEPVTYVEYTTPFYGITTADYAMPRSEIDNKDVTLQPLSTGTTFMILGEQGSYYKIFDGSFVAKANVTKHSGTLPDNRVTSVTVTDDEVNNLLVTKLVMNVNTLYQVEFTENRVHLTLFETITTPKVTLGTNDTVYRVAANIYRSKNRTVVYTYKINEGMSVTGYDVEFKDGAMYFYLKKQPHLNKEGSLTGATVVLDSGHGGTETGAVGPMGLYGPVEKDINLSITLLTKKYLEEMGATVLLTHFDDTTLSLKARVAFIRSVKPDISLSIHANSMPQAANYNLSYSFLTYYSYTLGNDAAVTVNDEIIKELDFLKRKIRRESLSLTRITTNPAVLIETAFMSYPADYEYLLYMENQDHIARAAANSIREYLESYAVYQRKTYTVKWGDTLSRIASHYGVSVLQLKKWNGISDINLIYGGQTLFVSE